MNLKVLLLFALVAVSCGQEEVDEGTLYDSFFSLVFWNSGVNSQCLGSSIHGNQSNCELVGGTFSSSTTPSYNTCDTAGVTQADCTGNSGTWTPATFVCQNSANQTDCANNSGVYTSETRQCKIFNETDCLAESATWISSKTCTIDGKVFSEVSGGGDSAICEKYGDYVGSGYCAVGEASISQATCDTYAGTWEVVTSASCSLSTEVDCNNVSGSWEEVTSASCSITTNETDCSNAGGTWETFPSETTTSCSNYDISSLQKCGSVGGRWNFIGNDTAQMKCPTAEEVEASGCTGEGCYTCSEMHGRVAVRLYSSLEDPVDLSDRSVKRSSSYTAVYLTNQWKYQSPLSLLEDLKYVSDVGGDTVKIQAPMEIKDERLDERDFSVEIKLELE